MSRRHPKAAGVSHPYRKLDHVSRSKRQPKIRHAPPGATRRQRQRQDHRGRFPSYLRCCSSRSSAPGIAREEAEAQLAMLIERAVGLGIGWPEIAAQLGVTRQAARQHYQRRHREDAQQVRVA
jgi:hypothetical protein